MTQQKVSWIGCEVGDYAIEHMLQDGAYSTVYIGNHGQTSAKKAFKVAKTRDSLESDFPTGSFVTRALAQDIDGTIEFWPDTEELLAAQVHTLKTLDAGELVAVDEFIRMPGICYYSMNFVEGQTLRQLLANDGVTIEQLISVARNMDHLSKNKGFVYHGDLKPENIITTDRSIVLIDPGYFGDLSDGRTTLPECAVTTPAYYPMLQPDDLFAFGLIVWESALGVHPLERRGFSGRSDLSRIGPRLLQLVKDQETVGKYFLSSLLDIMLPSQICPGLDANVERLLLKGLRLEPLPGGKLELTEGFRTWSAFAGALLALHLAGKKYLSAL